MTPLDPLEQARAAAYDPRAPVTPSFVSGFIDACWHERAMRLQRAPGPMTMPGDLTDEQVKEYSQGVIQAVMWIKERMEREMERMREREEQASKN